MATTRKTLVEQTEVLLTRLHRRARSRPKDGQPPLSFADHLKLAETSSRFLQAKSKLEPGDTTGGSELAALRSELTGDLAARAKNGGST